MRIRSLVPALACLAAAPLATAADTPAVKIDGFVDSILSASSTDSDTAGVSGSESSFSYGAKLGVSAAISDKVAAQVDIVADGDDGSANIRQAYGTWKINDTVDLKSGKFISDVGWVAAYSPGLYRINAGPILSLYGQDQVGARVGYAAGDIGLGLTVANGLFDANEANNNGQTGQGNEKYAYVADITFALPEKKGSVNGELAYDTGVTGKGGDALHLGVNASIYPSEPLTIAAELIWQSFGAPDGSTAEDSTHLGFLAMANFKLGDKLPVPASVTGMVQMVQASDYGLVDPYGLSPASALDVTLTELSVALLTNPAGTDKLGLNFELSYSMVSSEPSAGGTEVESSTVGVGAELLYVF